jgi:two-component system, NarL family, response regulator YdfI
VIAVSVLAPSPMARARLEALISRRSGLRLVDSSERGRLDAGDVLVVDPGARPLERVVRMLPRGDHAPSVVVLVGEPPRGGVGRLLRAGVRGILARDSSEREVQAGIEAVAAGLLVLHPSAVPSATARLGERRPADGPVREPLTPRELEVLTLLAEGMGNRAIASAMGITTHTVKFHVAAILEKLHARRRTDAVAIAMRLGVLVV